MYMIERAHGDIRNGQRRVECVHGVERAKKG